ncbi:transcription factor subunit Med10 of mediator complex-domain-containing protein [Sporodiniella umbellata]|nr:transcription factor subunit Med10 of mediator complex-domain-containing protein [Sporodiniella umbellata]
MLLFSAMSLNRVSSDNARHLLKNQLDELLQNLFELSVIVYDFQPDGNKLVWKKINNILEYYRAIEDLRGDVPEHIPEEVINFVEHGKNPDLFTQSFVERTATENQYTNGKVKAVDEFKKLLAEEFTKSFPDLYDYQNIVDYE